MPESTDHEMILISTSWQALKRTEIYNADTEMCNCIVVIIFACFYIEASLTHIIAELGATNEMLEFLKNPHPGLQEKLAWFYNHYMAHNKVPKKKDLKKIYPQLEEKFPGYSKLRNFRNNIAHGVIDRSITNIEDANDLRDKAKKIVYELQKIALNNGAEITRNITYEMAISGNEVTISN